MQPLLVTAAVAAQLTCSEADPCVLPSIAEVSPEILPPNPWAAWDRPPERLRARYDVIVILGCPSQGDGAPSACQRRRVQTALELTAAGYSDTFIVTGAAVHNDHVEAVSLRDLLILQGVPSSRVFLEPHAQHTDENLSLSASIMLKEGWDSALVVSSPQHLLYAALCDATCCVRAGRLAPFSWPTSAADVKAAAWVLFPAAAAADAGECDALLARALCTQLDERQMCEWPSSSSIQLAR